MKTQIEITVNGIRHEVFVSSQRTLLEVLRQDLGLTGTKEGCGLGGCGTCTVILDGQATLSCVTLAVAVDGAEITTIEGVAQNGQLHPIQQAFIDHGAVQCGFCTPGMIMSSKALLDVNPAPTDEDVRIAIAGNLCRCTGYHNIVKAVLAAGDVVRDGSGG